FYRGFYVYKYATGLSAAIALSQHVMNGDSGSVDRYLNFLKAGSSRDPLDLLRDAGVDMERPRPIEVALHRLENLVSELESLLK
ncbi:MAG TPA: M3 family metallopeptidase, partial [Pirellulaceae bacterium]